MQPLENIVVLSFSEVKFHPALLRIVATLSMALEQSEAEAGMVSCTASMPPSVRGTSDGVFF